MATVASFVHCLPNILHTVMATRQLSGDTTVTEAYFKVIGLFHIKFLKNGV